jgi:AbiU2
MGSCDDSCSSETTSLHRVNPHWTRCALLRAHHHGEHRLPGGRPGEGVLRTQFLEGPEADAGDGLRRAPSSRRACVSGVGLGAGEMEFTGYREKSRIAKSQSDSLNVNQFGASMNNPYEQMRDYLRSLVNHCLNTDSMNRQLSEIAEWDDPRRREALELGAHFFHCVTYGLRRIVLVELTMLLSNTEDRSLIDWLNKAKTHAASLEPTSYNPNHDRRDPIAAEDYRKIVDDQLATIGNQQEVIYRIKRHRNKAIAHFDKRYFNDPEAIIAEFPVSKSDIDSLIGLIKEILQLHYSHLFGSDLDIKIHSPRTVHTILRYTLAFKRVREDSALLAKGFEPAKYLSDDPSGTA